HGRGHLGDVAHLCGEVGSEEVDVVGEVFPRATHTWHHRLPTQTPVRTHLARHARHFRGERAELLDHGVLGIAEWRECATHVYRNLLGEVAIGDGRSHLSDVAYLPGQVTGHRIDVVGEVFPGASHTRHHRLPTQTAFSAHLARHARHF